ncbi:hypothetical protein [Helicobacter sp. T3_23-1056]
MTFCLQWQNALIRSEVSKIHSPLRRILSFCSPSLSTRGLKWWVL